MKRAFMLMILLHIKKLYVINIFSRWIEAMRTEMDSMYANQVWTLVNPPEGIVPIGCK